MAQVKAHMRRTKKGKVVAVRSYDKRGREKKAEGYTYQPDVDTAALYDPSKPRNPFAGRIAKGQEVPKGLKRYRYDDTKLVQETEKKKRTLGRTEDPYTRFD